MVSCRTINSSDLISSGGDISNSGDDHTAIIASLDRKCVSGDSLETVNIEDHHQALTLARKTAPETTSEPSSASEWMQSGCSVHQQQHHLSHHSGGGCGGGGGIGGNGGGGGGSDAWSRLNETQLRELISEMAKKLEYTERMNWLCKYLYIYIYM